METVSIYDAMSARRKVKKEQKAWKYLRDLSSVNGSDLNKLAVIDGNRKYTYSQMFRELERYASVFTAMEMTEQQHARVGILGSTCADVIFSFYSLNMVGAQVSLVASWSGFNFTRIEETILDEKLTDFIVTDDIAQQDLVNELLQKRKKLGLRHVIIIHVPMKGATAMPIMSMGQDFKDVYMKALYRPICMDTLLQSFGNGPIHYAKQEIDETAFIIHTTGTTSGTGKPVPLSDSAINSAVDCFLKLKTLSLPFDNLVSAIMLDLSNSFAIIDQVHLPLAMGATVVSIPLGLLNPWFYKAISAYRISFLFSANCMFERWMKMPADTDFDFSSLKFVALGGQAVSAADKKRYYEFIEAHGGDNVTILNGYGLSELGGACSISTPDLDDESIGYPLPGITIRLYDEDTKRFFSPQDKGGEGVLYINSPSMANPELDGRDVIKIDIIDRKPYVCTNDAVRVDPDGRITYLGRANRFFISEEGRKYESGRVETEFSRLDTIEGSAIAPAFNKHHHDTVPMLCIKTRDGAGEPLDVVLDALRRVFIEEKKLPEDHIPFLVMLVDTLPLNSNGKIDLFRLNRGQISGDTYMVDPVRTDDQLTDFTLSIVDDGPIDPIEMVMNDISNDFKNNMPGNKRKRENGQGITREDTRNMIFERFDAMYYMHQQVMNNSRGMMRQWFPMLDQIITSGAQNIMGMLPKLPTMKDIEDMRGMMSDMRKMLPGFQDLVPKPNFPMLQLMPTMTPPTLPEFTGPAAQMMDPINQLHQMLVTMQKNFNEQMKQNNDQLLGFITKLFTPFAAQSDIIDADDAEYADAEYVDAKVLD